MKVWDLATLKPLAAIPGGSDWPLALAISPDGPRLAVGRYDGSLAIHDAATGQAGRRPHAPSPSPPRPPSPSSSATPRSIPPRPRGAARGSKLRVTLTGTGVGKATAVVFDEPGLDATIVPLEKPDANRLGVDLAVAADARVGLHRFGVITPLGVPPLVPFAVSAHPEAAEVEPGDDPARLKPVTLPAPSSGRSIGRATSTTFRFEAKAGQQLVFETLARSLGSRLNALLTLLDERGRTLAEATPAEGGSTRSWPSPSPATGPTLLRVADADFAARATISTGSRRGASPLVTSVFPLGVERGQTTTVARDRHEPGRGLERADAGRRRGRAGRDDRGPGRPARRPHGRSVAGRWSWPKGRRRVEAEANDEPGRAEPVATPGGISARIGTRGGRRPLPLRGQEGGAADRRGLRAPARDADRPGHRDPRRPGPARPPRRAPAGGRDRRRLPRPRFDQAGDPPDPVEQPGHRRLPS